VKIDARIFSKITRVYRYTPPGLPLSVRLVENYVADVSRDERAGIEFNNDG